MYLGSTREPPILESTKNNPFENIQEKVVVQRKSSFTDDWYIFFDIRYFQTGYFQAENKIWALSLKHVEWRFPWTNQYNFLKADWQQTKGSFIVPLLGTTNGKLRTNLKMTANRQESLSFLQYFYTEESSRWTRKSSE